MVSLRPLDGYVVGITADRRWEEQAELLNRRGATVVHGPTITTLYLADDDTLRRATAAVIGEPPDYLVATTGIGVRAWFETAAVWGVADNLMDALKSARVVARGPKAAAAAQAAGLDVWAKSADETMDDVVSLLRAEEVAGRRVAVQQYGMETPELTAALAAMGASVVEVPVYRWQIPTDTAPALQLIEATCEGRVDAVTFTAAPAIHNLFAIAASGGFADDLRDAFNVRGVVAACVGPVCAEGAYQNGITTPVVPNVGRLGLLVRALSDHLEQQRRTFSMGGAVVVVQGSAVAVGDAVLEFTPRERAVFQELAAKPGAVVTRPQLLDRVWGSPDGDDHVLDVTVARLRRKLGDAGPALETVAGRGYRLN